MQREMELCGEEVRRVAEQATSHLYANLHGVWASRTTKQLLLSFLWTLRAADTSLLRVWFAASSALRLGALIDVLLLAGAHLHYMVL